MTDWISVNDKMPKCGELVLIYIANLNDGKGTYALDKCRKVDGKKEWEFYNKGNADFDVTHWVPLPEPPEHETTTFKPIATDARGYACQFSCNVCDCVVSMAYYMRPNQFDYNYCPYCGRPKENNNADM